MEQRGPIRFSTSILRRLGEELNPHVDQGILELVKNSYDADAINCVVELGVLDGDYDAVVVSDDGDGMSVDDILTGWLVLGSSKKETSSKTNLGRVPAGNKGLGRLAALRLGRVAKLSTKTRGSDEVHQLTIDWDQYDDAELVDQVSIEVVTTVDATRPHGTRIEVSKLRKQIMRSEVKRLARAMVLLADPFGDQESGFKPSLRAPDFEDLAELVAGRYFADAELHLSAMLVDGRARAEVTDWRGQMLYSARQPDLDPNRGLYNAPDAVFDLWAFNLNAETFLARNATVTEVRNWLGAFGGVHIYTNGLRVAPYGNTGDDWLELNLARARNPEFRPSTNNSIGRLLLDDPGGRLIQKTDRGGFIESTEFEDLRRFAIDALDWMARRRLDEAEKRRELVRQEAQSDSDVTGASVRESIKSIADPGTQAEVEGAFRKYNAARQKEADALRREVQLYRTLSTAGITAATFAHESNGNPLKVIDTSLNSLEFRTKQDSGETFSTRYAPAIKRMRDASASLGVLSSATLRLLEQDKRRASKVDLQRTVTEVLQTFAPFLDGRAVELKTQFAPGAPFVRGTEAALESIVTNLLNNSLNAFERSQTKHRIIDVRTDLDNGFWVLEVLDNGTGIQGISLKDIWLPGQTSRADGTGLGLTIVRDAVADLGGAVEAEAEGELGGATFRVRVPILGA